MIRKTSDFEYSPDRGIPEPINNDDWVGKLGEPVMFPDMELSAALMETLTSEVTSPGMWLAAVIEELGPGHWKWDCGMWFWIQDAEAQDDDS